ncbi:MAG: glutamine synthetase, partial [Rhodospirillaceae bacterium]|nr:glutamine synthetase [Rhodospirillaceae bacterium]
MASGELILLIWNDLVGLSRTRGVPVSQYERRMDHGLGWALAGQSLTPFEDIAPNPWGPLDEVRQTPDDSTRRRVEFFDGLPPLHMVLCNSMNTDGTPWECCTRSFMQQALDDLEAETGLSLHIAYENEFLLSGEGMEWAAPFSIDSIRRVAPFADLCTSALLAADVGLETFEPEYGVGQYEVSCGPAVGISGADRVVITREVIREAARQCDIQASFSPKPAPEAVGNGCHLHLSLWDKNHRPVGFDPDGPGQMGPIAAQFVAGVHRHLAALT